MMVEGSGSLFLVFLSGFSDLSVVISIILLGFLGHLSPVIRDAVYARVLFYLLYGYVVRDFHALECVDGLAEHLKVGCGPGLLVLQCCERVFDGLELVGPGRFLFFAGPDLGICIVPLLLLGGG